MRKKELELHALILRFINLKRDEFKSLMGILLASFYKTLLKREKMTPNVHHVPHVKLIIRVTNGL